MNKVISSLLLVYALIGRALASPAALNYNTEEASGAYCPPCRGVLIEAAIIAFAIPLVIRWLKLTQDDHPLQLVLSGVLLFFLIAPIYMALRMLILN